jgi:hypothetical protein
MATARTWLFIILGVVALLFVGCAGVVGLGFYFVTQHISTTHATSATAVDRFQQALEPFKNQAPLIRADAYGHGSVELRIADLPTSAIKPTELHVLAYQPDRNDQLVQVSLPMWLLKLGHRKMQFGSADFNDDFDRLHLDAAELERIGPKLILDVTRPDGSRVLVWTK